MKPYQLKAISTHGTECMICGGEYDVVHHIDGHRGNNNIENLAPLCNSCHRKVHASPKSVPGWSDKLPRRSLVYKKTRRERYEERMR